MDSGVGLRVLSVAQDAGGASVVGPVLAGLRSRGTPCRVLAAEPALGILGKRPESDGHAEQLSPDPAEAQAQIGDAFEKWRPTVLLVGTSHGASPDQRATLLAKDLGVPSLAVLDSWCNYALRFSGAAVQDHLLYLPDVIAVMDDQARDALMRLGIPDSGIVITGHPGFDQLVEFRAGAPTYRMEVARRLQIDPRSWWILFVSENGEEIYRQFPNLNPGYTELDVFRMLIPAVEGLARQRPVAVIVRRHPGEWLAKYPTSADGPTWMRVDSTVENARELVWSTDAVVGISSTLLLEAFLLGRPVVSVQPIPRIEDPFVLTQRGRVPVVRSTSQLSLALRTIADPPVGMEPVDDEWTNFLMDGQATRRVIRALDRLAAPRTCGCMRA